MFESMFGNTAALAEDVRGGPVDAGASVALADVTSVPAHPLLGCHLLVLAAPTHALALSRPESRAEAVSKGADPARPAIAVFDTRMVRAKHWPGLVGLVQPGAATPIGPKVPSRGALGTTPPRSRTSLWR